MLRRIILTAALAACTAIPAWAQTRATYVLSNGEKHNGVIVYGRGDNNIVDDKFHVNASGVELVFEHSDVAVIDFVGGTAPTAELQALPNEGELMVMRDGSVQRGHLHNILKPDLVQWVNEAGQRNNYPIGEVRRLYLNPGIARSVFFGKTSSAVAQTRTVLGRNSTAIRVDGNVDWVDSGIDVRRGDRIAVTATGQVQFGPGNTATPAGARGGSPNYPVPTAGAGGLIAKVGDSAPFAVGAGNRTLTMPADGRLMFGINDDNVSDNSGSFGVTVRR
jgi:hypothetical protein